MVGFYREFAVGQFKLTGSDHRPLASVKRSGGQTIVKNNVPIIERLAKANEGQGASETKENRKEVSFNYLPHRNELATTRNTLLTNGKCVNRLCTHSCGFCDQPVYGASAASFPRRSGSPNLAT
jgi:hypothetical protein